MRLGQVLVTGGTCENAPDGGAHATWSGFSYWWDLLLSKREGYAPTSSSTLSSESESGSETCPFARVGKAGSLSGRASSGRTPPVGPRTGCAAFSTAPAAFSSSSPSSLASPSESSAACSSRAFSAAARRCPWRVAASTCPNSGGFLLSEGGGGAITLGLFSLSARVTSSARPGRAAAADPPKQLSGVAPGVSPRRALEG